MFSNLHQRPPTKYLFNRWFKNGDKWNIYNELCLKISIGTTKINIYMNDLLNLELNNEAIEQVIKEIKNGKRHFGKYIKFDYNLSYDPVKLLSIDNFQVNPIDIYMWYVDTDRQLLKQIQDGRIKHKYKMRYVLNELLEKK